MDIKKFLYKITEQTSFVIDIVLKYLDYNIFGNRETIVIGNVVDDIIVEKLYDYRTNEIAILYVQRCPIFNSSKIFKYFSIYDTNIIKKILRKGPILESIKNMNINGIIYNIVWIKKGDKFDKIYDFRLEREIILTLDNSYCIIPGYNLIEIKLNNNLTLHYDKHNQYLIDTQTYRCPILLSHDNRTHGHNLYHRYFYWGCSVESEYPLLRFKIEKNNIFDIKKLLRILPDNFLSPKNLVNTNDELKLLYLRIVWVPINEKFVIYNIPGRGESIRFENEFNYVA